MPESPPEAEIHICTLLGTTMGHCSIVTCVASVGKGKLLAFIPPPVLAVIKAGNVADELRSCGWAPLQLANAMTIFHQPPQNETKVGKAWEPVLAAALLLYTRSNGVFSPVHFLQRRALW